MQDGTVVSIDELKGRVVRDRRWPAGLQTALELKERVTRHRQGRVPGSVTMENFMALYPRICGMLNGKEQTMVPVLDDDELWFIFRDVTSGETTYPAARFLYTSMPKDGKVEIDFNRAENPPCAFNPYATCPLPMPENRLKTRIEAGEMYTEH